MALAVFGLLPDVVNPHIYLEDRLSSWSHTIWFVVGIGLLMVPFVVKRKIGFSMAMWMVMAAALHIFCDGISGGVNVLYPYGHTIGVSWVPPDYWIPLDLVVATIALVTGIEVRRRFDVFNQSLAGSR